MIKDNKSQQNCFQFRDQDENKFDGLPTSKKLEMMSKNENL